MLEGKTKAAANQLMEARSLAEMYQNSRAYWRILGNLGALALISGDCSRARDYLLASFDVLRRRITDKFCIVRELSLFGNILVVSRILGDIKMQEDVFNIYSDARLRTYSEVLLCKLETGNFGQLRHVQPITISNIDGVGYFLN